MTMPSLCGYVRPYPGRLGRQIVNFVEELGFPASHGMLLPEGCSDERAARWIQRTKMDLLVLPFHLHRGESGEVLDGIGVLQAFVAEADLSGLVIFMPVRAFSWGSSFQRRMDALREYSPATASQILAAHQDEIGTATLASRLRRALDTAKAQSPRRVGAFTGLSSLVPPSDDDVSPSSSQRPFGFLSASGSIAPREIEVDSAGARSTRGMPSTPGVPSSRRALASGGVPSSRGAQPSSGTVSKWEKPESSSPRSLVLPKLPADLEVSELKSAAADGGLEQSAMDSFKRAAEIGARARRDAEAASVAKKRRQKDRS